MMKSSIDFRGVALKMSILNQVRIQPFFQLYIQQENRGKNFTAMIEGGMLVTEVKA